LFLQGGVFNADCKKREQCFLQECTLVRMEDFDVRGGRILTYKKRKQALEKKSYYGIVLPRKREETLHGSSTDRGLASAIEKTKQRRRKVKEVTKPLLLFLRERSFSAELGGESLPYSNLPTAGEGNPLCWRQGKKGNCSAREERTAVTQKVLVRRAERMSSER